MDTLQCAVVLAKLERFEWELERRIAIGKSYLERLAACEVATPVRVKQDRDPVWGQFTVLVEDRSTVKTRLESAGIPTAIHYPIPLHRQPAYESISAMVSCPVSEQVAERVLSLPMSAYMDEAQVDRVVLAMNGK
jgi:UDP-2-acetamido-2-deoxy-ribo-hexuluronate aminotransferase